MTKQQQPSSPPPEDTEESTRFDRMVRALFRVDKRDVPKHEPKRRASLAVTNNDVEEDTGPDAL